MLIGRYGVRVDSATPQGATALHLSAQAGSVATTAVLLAHGANLSAAAAQGDTPLHTAAGAGHVVVSQLLVEAGASLDIANHAGVRVRDLVEVQ